MKGKDTMYSIGQFSKLTGISIVALRYYDERGVIRPEIKKDNGYRYYAERQLLQAQFVNNLKEIGMPLEEIAEVLAAKDPAYTLQKISEMKFKLQEQINELAQIEAYFAKGVVSRNTAIISKDSVERGVLEGCKYISMDIREMSMRQVFTFDCLQLQTLRGEIGCYQKAGIRIIHKAHNTAEKDILIMPLLGSDRQLRDAVDIADIKTMPGYETISTIVCKSTLDLMEEVRRLEEIAKEMNIQPEGSPILECLLDPGDVPDMNQYIARLHLIIG